MELRDRVRKLGAPGVEWLTVTTFHSWALRVVQRNHKALRFTRTPAVMASNNDRYKLCKEAIRSSELDIARQDIVSWMSTEFTQESSWQEIRATVENMYPALYLKAMANAASGRLGWIEMHTELYDALHEHFTGSRQAEKLGADPHKNVVRKFYDWLNKVKSHSHTAAMYAHERGYGDAFLEYQNILLTNNMVDFDDILVLAHKLMATDPDLLKMLQKHYQYLLIDEYQDSNPVQMSIVDAMQRQAGRVTVVGDDAQSIYRFRGADCGAFQAFQQSYGHEDLHRSLQVNFRSRPPVVRAAEAGLLGTQSAIFPKRLIPHKFGGTAPVTLYIVDDDWNEARFIAKQIAKMHYEERLPLEHMVVLFRALKNGRSKRLQEELTSKGIHFRMVKEYPFMEREFVADMMSFLHLSVNPDCDQAFSRMMNKPPRKLGKAAEQVLNDRRSRLADETGRHISLYEAARGAINEKDVVNFTKGQIDGYLDYLKAKKEKAAKKEAEASADNNEWWKQPSSPATPVREAPAEEAAAPAQPRKPLKHGKGRVANAIAAGLSDEEWEQDFDEDEDLDEDELGVRSVAWSEGMADVTLEELNAMFGDEHLVRLYRLAQQFERSQDVHFDMTSPASQDEGSMPHVNGQSSASSTDDGTPAVASNVIEETAGPEEAGKRVPLSGVKAVHEFMGYVSCDDELADDGTSDHTPGVTIGTIHSAKGLEWHTVFLVRCNEGIMPMGEHRTYGTEPIPQWSPDVLHALPPAESEAQKAVRDREEELRLVHVGMTRAKERLILTCLQKVYNYKKKQPEPIEPAAFLDSLRALDPTDFQGDQEEKAALT
ncbi:hypothetical protein WJX73_003315 [Symbiochloris irregularis]|uniref:DNA 3'-5' helicase n=1 Tax=Symbiochloris irregularis TaxID=706552 RepID=A0AAW1PUV8_9CHLO